MSRIVCYTCITGGYDSLKQPQVVDEDVDYVCFTDNIPANAGAWQTMPIPDELKFLSNVKQQRVVKICPHKWLSKYDVSVWVDGNFLIKGSISQFVSQYDLSKVPFYTRVHPCRDCIYEEAKVCIDINKDHASVINEQIDKYRNEGYPKNIGMVETGILLRRHNDNKCKIIDNYWAAELLMNSHRDQLSFNYVCWKQHFLPGYLKNEFKPNNRTFQLMCHGR